MRNSTVVIVGGGASGTLAATALIGRSPHKRVVIIDPRPRLGRGIAYSTECPEHLLNVPAGKISAFPDRPDHFVRWLRANVAEPYDAASFVPRSLYGDYLTQIAAEARAAAPDRFRHVVALALRATPSAGGVRVTCSNGETIEADELVLATGNAAPAKWRNVSPEALCSDRFFGSAWDAGAIVPAHPDETVLLLGTGLTAVDAVLGLRHYGHRGTIYMVSRRGLLPHEHRVFDTPPTACPEADTVSALLESVRKIVREAQPSDANWRSVVDSVRPRTNALWQALSLGEQRRFLRHALPYWNVHRHRIPPASAKAIAELMAANDLRMLAGRTGRIVSGDGNLRVPIKLRGSSTTLLMDADRIINCSGPEHDFRKLSNPLIASLLEQGAMIPYPLNIGVRIAPTGALIGADGSASERLFAIGPARYGTLIETTAIPEIRSQALELAETLAGDAAAGTTLADAG
jgi:uncharacterized NAD(P)/FAD-binding protein YdhS